MKPEAADYLGKARQCLDDAKQIAAATPLHHIVAREAYLAAYHAAEAYLFERTGKAAKTHRGLRSEFGRLARGDPRIGREFLTFLAEGCEDKSNAELQCRLAVDHERGCASSDRHRRPAH